MQTVYEAPDYKSYLKDWITDRPKGGRGESRKIAEKLGVSTTLVSQVLNGDKHFTMEAASDLSDHMGLSDRESDHFLLLVDHARAGSHRLKQKLEKRIQASRMAARKLSERVGEYRALTDAESAVYYSHWGYSGVTNLIAVDPQADIEQMAARLKVPENLIKNVLNFLLESGVIVNQGGSLVVGSKLLHIDSQSPLVVKHHQNWRLRAFDKMPFKREEDLFFTAPMAVSSEVAEKIRADLPAYIQKVSEWVGPSKEEVVRCLNIDWFEY